MPSTLHTSSHLIGTITQRGKYYSSHFTDEEILLVSDGAGIRSQAACFRMQALNHHAYHLSPTVTLSHMRFTVTDERLLDASSNIEPL